MKSFSELTEQELLALAISSEDDDARAYAGFAHSLMDTYPASAKVFMEMAEEEHEHRSAGGDGRACRSLSGAPLGPVSMPVAAVRSVR